MLVVATGGATCFGAIAASLQDKVAQTAWNARSGTGWQTVRAALGYS
jgi:hypothetical protein